jgi:hypothetical protein
MDSQSLQIPEDIAKLSSTPLKNSPSAFLRVQNHFGGHPWIKEFSAGSKPSKEEVVQLMKQETVIIIRGYNKTVQLSNADFGYKKMNSTGYCKYFNVDQRFSTSIDVDRRRLFCFLDAADILFVLALIFYS